MRKLSKNFSKSVMLVIIITLIATALPYKADAANVWKIYKEAEAARKKGDHKLAIAKYQETIPLFVASKDIENVANMYNYLAESQKALNLFDDAVKSWDNEAIWWSKAKKVQLQIAAKRKADLVRSTIKMFVRTDAAEFGDQYYHGAKYEPKLGAYIGAYAESDPGVHDAKDGNPFYITAFPELTGKQHAAYLLYVSWGLPFSTYKSHIERAKKNNVALQIAFQPLKGLSEVADNEYLRTFAKDVKASGIPVFLRFANEMNGKWVEWYEKDPKKYIEKFRVVSKVFKEEADNVAMVWSPNFFPPDNLESYYPGDDYVDWVGVSMYNTYQPELDPLKKNIDRTSFVQKFDHIYKTYSKKKPVFISEAGASYSDPKTGNDVTRWAMYQTEQFYASLPLLYPGVKGMFWFDTDKLEGANTNRYTLSKSTGMLDVYKKGIQNNFYLSAIGDEAKYGYREISTTTVKPAVQELSLFVKTVDPYVAKVAYYVNKKEIAKATSAPWTFSFDCSAYKGKKIEITVKAFDNKGKLLTTSVQKISVSAK
ncbi:MAG: glycosyl hydrolase [Paenibacillaceae bacterium]